MMVTSTSTDIKVMTNASLIKEKKGGDGERDEERDR